jgi:hypothetical protein
MVTVVLVKFVVIKKVDNVCDFEECQKCNLIVITKFSFVACS